MYFNFSSENYNDNEQEYDFYDNEDVESNSGEFLGNYSYSYQENKPTLLSKPEYVLFETMQRSKFDM
jgi:hypothetical protein